VEPLADGTDHVVALSAQEREDRLEQGTPIVTAVGQ